MTKGPGYRFSRSAFLLLLVLVAAGGGGCGIFGGGKPAPPPGGAVGPHSGAGDGREITLLLSTDATLNTCGDGPANALGVRIYQLAGDRGIAGAPQVSLWEGDEKELGEELIARQEFFLDPQMKQTVKLRLDKQAQFLAVVGNFCKSEGSCWKWTHPIDGLPSEMELRFGATCVQEKRSK